MTTENITIPVMSSDPITLFVAMPYTDLGEHAKWRKPQNVEDFYKQVGQSIGRRMNRTVELRIEKYSPQSGLVIDAMFRAIHTADVFIADLTGSNANVFLELKQRLHFVIGFFGCLGVISGRIESLLCSSEGF